MRKNNSCVVWPHLGNYVSQTNQIATLRYVSCINQIATLGMVVPIRMLGYCPLCQSSHGISIGCCKVLLWNQPNIDTQQE